MKTDEPTIVTPAPLWGDETNGPDVSTFAWYGAGAGGSTVDADAAGTTPGHYGPTDNHGKAGANFAFTDGHAAFLTGNIHDTFYLEPPNASPQSVNAVDRFRSRRTQTLD